MYKFIWCILLVSSSLLSWSQNIIRSSGIELYKPYLSNPAFVAADSAVQIDFMAYSFWTAIPGHPQEMYLSAIIPLEKLHGGIQLGASTYNIGAISEYSLQYGYAYKINIKEHMALLLGTQVHYSRLIVDALVFDPDDPLVQELNDNPHHGLSLNVGLGFSYKRLTVGISSMDNWITKKTMGFERSLFPYAHSYMFANYDFNIMGAFHAIPQFSFFTREKAEISLVTTYRDIFKLGLAYKFGERTYNRIITRKRIAISAGTTLFNQLSVTVFFTPDYYSLYNEKTGYNLMGQIGLRF